MAKIEFEHFEAHAERISKLLVKEALEIIDREKLPLDVLLPALDLVSFEVIKKIVEKYEEASEMLAIGCTEMLTSAQVGAFKIRLEWLEAEQARLQKRDVRKR